MVAQTKWRLRSLVKNTSLQDLVDNPAILALVVGLLLAAAYITDGYLLPLIMIGCALVTIVLEFLLA